MKIPVSVFFCGHKRANSDELHETQEIKKARHYTLVHVLMISRGTISGHELLTVTSSSLFLMPRFKERKTDARQ